MGIALLVLLAILVAVAIWLAIVVIKWLFILGVFVLGMHRSGTSVATRLINLLGLPAPTEEDLLPPDRGNPRGYWESSSLVACNDRLLEALGSEMTCPEAFSPGWERDPRLHAFYPEAAKLFGHVFPAPPWVFKDP